MSDVEAMPSYVSETDTCREILAPFCHGIGIDAGYGGSKITPDAWAFDMPRPYTNVGKERQQLRGDARSFPFLCDGALDYLYSSHLLEDWSYSDLVPMIIEWRRVIKPGGLLVTNCPDQQRFLAHISFTGQGNNLAHVEADMSLRTFRDRVVQHTGEWLEVFVKEEHGPYSWLLVLQKVGER